MERISALKTSQNSILHTERIGYKLNRIRIVTDLKIDFFGSFDILSPKDNLKFKLILVSFFH